MDLPYKQHTFFSAMSVSVSVSLFFPKLLLNQWSSNFPGDLVLALKKRCVSVQPLTENRKHFSLINRVFFLLHGSRSRGPCDLIKRLCWKLTAQHGSPPLFFIKLFPFPFLRRRFQHTNFFRRYRCSGW